MWEKPLNLGDKIQTDLVFRALHYCASPVFSFIYLFFLVFGFFFFPSQTEASTIRIATRFVTVVWKQTRNVSEVCL